MSTILQLKNERQITLLLKYLLFQLPFIEDSRRAGHLISLCAIRTQGIREISNNPGSRCWKVLKLATNPILSASKPKLHLLYHVSIFRHCKKKKEKKMSYSFFVSFLLLPSFPFSWFFGNAMFWFPSTYTFLYIL